MTDSISSVKPEAVVELAVQDLVKRGLQLLEDEGDTPEGLQRVYSAIADSTSEYIHGELYLYIVSLDGTILAHGVQPERVGFQLFESRDSTEVIMVKEMLRIATEEGSGWLDYPWEYPGTDSVLAKRAYVVRPENMDLLIGCGYYLTSPHASE